jgi:hypothetical protein
MSTALLVGAIVSVPLVYIAYLAVRIRLSFRLTPSEKHRPEKVHLIAHRGASGEYPENTLLAFEKALDANIHGLELDLQVENPFYVDPQGRRKAA